LEAVTAPETVERKLESARQRFLRLCQEAGVAADPLKSAIRVEKSRRRLILLCGGRVLKEYPVVVGACPVGHKKREGDKRTPVGDYYICYRNPESRFHLFMGLSYPNEADARAGLAEGVIDQRKYEEIADTVARKDRPDWYTPLGGEVGIHGGGTSRPGTAGCMALRNEDVEELWGATALGTPVVIVD
jgi:murein L,D-transpeptidase YafK